MPKIQLRHDTSTNWTTYNPVLLEGECGVETDTNKFKFGDGTTAWNSLDYVSGADLSNYYNKTETDELLGEKQDTFTPTSPLAMRQAPPKTGNMDIDVANGTATTSLGSDVAMTYGSNSGIISYKTPASSDADYIKEHFWDNVSYIDIPYTFPQTVCAGSQIDNSANDYNGIILGKYDIDGSFIPMFWCDGRNFIDASNSTLSYEVNFGNNGYFIRANNATTYYGEVSAIPGSPYENDRAYGKVFQAWTSGQLGASRGTSVTFANADPQALASALSTATVARVCVYYNFGETNYPINLKHNNYLELGVYNYNQALYVGDLIAQGSLGTNLFDITDTTRPYYLDLSIGAGLAVQNGRLINTNPTAPSIMTGATSSTAGTSGLVPQPVAGDNTKFLSGDGTFKTVITDLSNLSPESESRLHALKGYSDEGELLTDAEGLADVKSYAHSTFDSTKFTKVGSPIITDDGVASGFSGSNYLTINLSSRTVSNIELQIKIKTKNLTTGQIYFSADSNYKFQIGSNSSGKLTALLGGGSSSTIYYNPDNLPTLTENTEYLIRAKFTSDKFELYLNNTLIGNTTLSSFSCDISQYFSNIGARTYGTAQYCHGSIYFKQFSITADGVEVFSGNRTGIDTIKPDNYTVVGTPTITADGVASGFSSSNYIEKTLNINNCTDLKVCCIVKVGSTSQNYIFDSLPNINNLSPLGLRVSTNIYFNYLDSNGSQQTLAGSNVSVGDVYYCEFKLEGTNATATFTNLITGNKDIKTSSTARAISIDNMKIGVARSVAAPWAGSIDLNAFKIYVDGNLVYQPCLKIPYTKAINGEKVVSSVYRPRVNDMRQQFGFACYRTLSDTDYTLPQTSVYQNNQRFLLDSSRSGISYWELYSDRTLEQGGTCVSGVEYNLVKRFADDNYVLTIPYSSKTATSFIPSATGDFIAKGQGLL